MDSQAQTPRAPRRGISSFWLKLAAIVAMTCNHAGYIFYAYLPFWARCMLICVGGLTFPVMAFLLVEGYRHTSNIKRYAARLAVFALIAQVPFWLFLGHEGNVLFTLLAGLGALWVYDNLEDGLAKTAAVLGCCLVTFFCDWGVLGPALVLLFYAFRDKIWGIAAAVLLLVLMGVANTAGPFASALAEGSLRNLPFLLYHAVGNTLAIPLLMAYNGTRGIRPMKWLFYVYYPAHIAMLGLIYLGLFGQFPPLLVG